MRATMDQNQLKRQAAEAALQYVPDDAIVGVGSGSTVAFFIAALGARRARLRGAVASSEASAALLRQVGIPLCELDTIDELPVYVDGADEIDHRLRMIKGGGGALTREKIVASVSRQFVCIADESKRVERLGRFPLPVEVIPMARRVVSRRLEGLGGRPVVRDGFVTDNGNFILDVHGLGIESPEQTESEIDQIAGVVTVGLFARKPADVLLLARAGGIETFHR